MSASTLPVSATGHGRFSLDDLASVLLLLPRNGVLAGLHAYRATISHTYGDVCKYYPSCSAYAVGAVQQHGVVMGAALTTARLARCHPWAQGGIDDVPIRRRFRHELTPHGFVVSPRKD